ncbi:MAG: hypothetical protein ACREMY_24910, partial [bacterium]
LVVRAALLLAERAGIPPRARLHLEKRTPMGGGLGGGSADAGAALLLLARFWNCEGPVRQALPELAAQLGSDVPFFLAGGEAEVTGRGEIVRSVDDGPQTRLLLLVPPFPISTAAVYRSYAGRGALPTHLEVSNPGRPRYLGPNDLTPAVLQAEPRMGGYLSSVARVSDDYAVSGSGSTIVLVDAPGARDELALRHPEARLFACATLSRAACRRRINPDGGAP